MERKKKRKDGDARGRLVTKAPTPQIAGFVLFWWTRSDGALGGVRYGKFSSGGEGGGLGPLFLNILDPPPFETEFVCLCFDLMFIFLNILN